MNTRGVNHGNRQLYRRSLGEVRADLARCVVCCTATALYSRKLLKAEYARGAKTAQSDYLGGWPLRDSLEELSQVLAGNQQVLLYVFQFVRGYRKKARLCILGQRSSVYTEQYLDSIWENMCTERMLELQLSSIVSSARSAMATKGAYEEPAGREVVGEASRRTRELFEMRGFELTSAITRHSSDSEEGQVEGQVEDTPKTREETKKEKLEELAQLVAETLQELLNQIKSQLQELDEI